MTDVPPIWVVNLARSPERRQFMQRQLDALGLSYEFVEAVDGRTLSERQKACYSHEQALEKIGRALAPGEIGCALTHALIYQRLLDQGLESVLVLEDDMILHPDLLPVLRSPDRFPSDWETIHLAELPHSFPVDFETIGKPIYQDYHVGRFLGWARCTGAYLINPAGARRLLESTYPISVPADALLGKTEHSGLTLYGIRPALVQFAQFHSDIWDYRWQWWELEHRADVMTRKDLFIGRLRARSRRYGQRLLGPLRERVRSVRATRRLS